MHVYGYELSLYVRVYPVSGALKYLFKGEGSIFQRKSFAVEDWTTIVQRTEVFAVCSKTPFIDSYSKKKV